MHSYYVDSLIVLIADIYATHRLFHTIANFMQLKHLSNYVILEFPYIGHFFFFFLLEIHRSITFVREMKICKTRVWGTNLELKRETAFSFVRDKNAQIFQLERLTYRLSNVVAIYDD